jgi:hypothetical protein
MYAMDDEYFDTLRRTGDAWEAYWDAANGARGDGIGERRRTEALWAEFQRCVVKLTTMHDARRG